MAGPSSSCPLGERRGTGLNRACCTHHAAILCEGSTLKSTFANALTLFMAEAAGIMKSQKKPCLAYGSEIGQMDPFLAKAVQRLCGDTWFIARTKQSLQALKRLGLEGHMGTDAAWSYEDAAPSEEIRRRLRQQGWDGRRPLLGIAVINPFCWPVRASLVKWVRGHLTGDLSGQYDHWYFFSDSPARRAAYKRYISRIAQGVNAFLEKNNYYPVLIGMERLDAKACRSSIESLKQLGKDIIMTLNPFRGERSKGKRGADSMQERNKRKKETDSMQERNKRKMEADSMQESGKHVLIAALSTFPYARKEVVDGEVRKVTRMRETFYDYEGIPEDIMPGMHGENPDSHNDSNADIKSLREVRHICSGYYQLEQISWFLRKELDEVITDVVLLATKETLTDRREILYLCPRLQPVNMERPEEAEKAEKHNAAVEKKAASQLKELELLRENTEPGWTAKEYYYAWLKNFWGESLRIHVLEIDELNPAGALDSVMKTIRSLYDSVEDKNTWRLWMDTHGGFRDISMVLVSAARFFATDKTEPIDTNGIFSVYHSQRPEINDRIIDQTAFYFTDSAKALRQFLDYGQYLSLKFQPYRESGKHAFVSYRHDPLFLTSVRSIFSKFEEIGIPYWYDDGIRYRDNWRDVLEKQNTDSEVFIGLLSNSYFKSMECWKELIRAVAVRKKRAFRNEVTEGDRQLKETGYSTVHFLMLEKNVDLSKVLPIKLEKEKETQEVRDLQEKLGVTDDDLRECLGIGSKNRDIQWFQWFGYMDRDDSIRQKSLADLDRRIEEAFSLIKKSIDG